MRVGILTSTRADYGIYRSLLRTFEEDSTITYGLFVFGTHLAAEHGRTVENIEADGHPIYERVDTLPVADDPVGISRAAGVTAERFAVVWDRWADRLDVVVALGDRYEMFAAVAAAVPFSLPVAHLHGGETSAGAIDDKYRHAITQLSDLHFTATETAARRVAAMVGSEAQVHYVGAPSLDGLNDLPLLTVAELRQRFGVDFSRPTVLFTFHPETRALAVNATYADRLGQVLTQLSDRYQIVITMPNADTLGGLFRERFTELAREQEAIVLVPSFGKIGYFSAMRHCAFLLGNTSSGLIEAASFGKYAIDLGDRQRRRVRGENVLSAPVEEAAILRAVEQVEQIGGKFAGTNVYVRDGRAAAAIAHHLRQWHRRSMVDS